MLSSSPLTSSNINQDWHLSIMQNLQNTSIRSNSFSISFPQLNFLPKLSSTKPDQIFPSSSQTRHNDSGQIQVMTVHQIPSFELHIVCVMTSYWYWNWKGVMCYGLFTFTLQFRDPARLTTLMLNCIHMGVCQERLSSQCSFKLDDIGLFHLPCQQKESWTENWKPWRKLGGSIYLALTSL